MGAVLGVLVLLAEPGDNAALASEPIAVDFCQLVDRALDFDNKRVRLTSQIITGFETFALMDDECPTDNGTSGMIWLETKDDGVGRYSLDWSISEFLSAGGKGVVESETGNLVWKVPIGTSRIPRTELDTLNRALRKRHVVRVSVIGRFDYANKGRLSYDRDSRLHFTPGFGHLGSFSRRIVIERVTPLLPTDN